MNSERELLQDIANWTAQDYPPGDQLKLICTHLKEAGILPQETARPTLRYWPPRTKFVEKDQRYY